MHDPFIPDPDVMRELDEIEAAYQPEDDPVYHQLEARAAEQERKMEVLGRTLFHIPGTIASYIEPESGSMWWRTVKGWREHRVYDGPNGKYARLSLTLDQILKLAGCA